mgnify:CR=1 FL=1
MALDKQTVKAFRNDFQDAVKKLEKSYGMTINLGTIRFNGYELRGKMTASKTLKSKIFAKNTNPKVGDDVKVNHKKVMGECFRVVKVNSKTCILVNTVSGRQVKVSKTLIY